MDILNYVLAATFVISIVALVVTRQKRYYKKLQDPIKLSYEGEFDLTKLLSIIRIHHFDHSDRWLAEVSQVMEAGFSPPLQGYPIVNLKRIEATRMADLYEGTVQLEYTVDGVTNTLTFNTIGAHVKMA